MSGLVALFHVDGRPADQSILEQLSASLSHRAVDGQTLWVSGSAGLAFQHFRTTPESTCEVQPRGCPPQLAICFDGRLDNRDELRQRLPSDILLDGGSASDAAIALASYRQFGESFPRELKGDFAIALFDETHQKLILARDVMGVRPLHYCRSGGTFLAASEIKAILAYPGFEARPDDDGLADFLLEGDWYERRLTCFKDVFRVVPGHTLVITATDQRSVQYFDFDPSKQLRFSSIEEYAEALRVLFQQAVRRRLRSSHPVGVLVSGGLDSSAILCQASLLRKTGVPVQNCRGVAMTFPRDTAAGEESYLDDLEATHNVEIRRLAVASHGIHSTFLRHTEVPRLLWDSAFKCASVFQEMRCRVVLDGYYGDQMMHSDAHLIELIRRLRYCQFRRELTALSASMTDVSSSYWRRYFLEALVRDMTPRFLKHLASRLEGIFRPELRPSWYRKAFRRRALLRRVHQRRPEGNVFSDQRRSCYGLVTSAHCLNMLEEGNKTAAALGLEQSYPFLDRELIEFVAAIPASIVNWRGRSKGLFRETMRNVLPESIRQRSWKADFTTFANEALAEDYPRFEGYLQANCLAEQRGYLDATRLQKEFSTGFGLRSDSVLPANRVFGALGLECWLRAFFSEKSVPRSADRVAWDMGGGADEKDASSR